jgi:hypothetical protein
VMLVPRDLDLIAAGHSMPLPLPKPSIPEVEAKKDKDKPKNAANADNDARAAKKAPRHAGPARLRYRYYYPL